MTNEPKSLGALLFDLPAVRRAKKVNTLSRVHRRLIEPIETEQDNEPRLSFQHTVFCQADLPYRNPGDDARPWRQGRVTLEIQAGRVLNQTTQDFVDFGLPWGTKPRLILAHLNAEPLRHDSPVIEVEHSLSSRPRAQGANATTISVQQTQQYLYRLFTGQLRGSALSNRSLLWRAPGFSRDDCIRP